MIVREIAGVQFPHVHDAEDDRVIRFAGTLVKTVGITYQLNDGGGRYDACWIRKTVFFQFLRQGKDQIGACRLAHEDDVFGRIVFQQIPVSVFAVSDRIDAGKVRGQPVIHGVDVIAEVLYRVGNEFEQLPGGAVYESAPVDIIKDLILGICVFADNPARTVLELDFFKIQSFQELFVERETVIIHFIDAFAHMLNKLVGQLHMIRHVVLFEVSPGFLNRQI